MKETLKAPLQRWYKLFSEAVLETFQGCEEAFAKRPATAIITSLGSIALMYVGLTLLPTNLVAGLATIYVARMIGYLWMFGTPKLQPIRDMVIALTLLELVGWGLIAFGGTLIGTIVVMVLGLAGFVSIAGIQKVADDIGNDAADKIEAGAQQVGSRFRKRRAERRAMRPAAGIA